MKTLLTFTPELKDRLIKKAKDMFGERQGFLSMYVEMVLRKELGLTLERVEEV